VSTSHAAAGSYYTDDSLYAFEQEQVFAREWLFVCHAAQIPEAGDYVMRTVAGESLLIMRDRDDEIRAFYNVCHPFIRSSCTQT